MAHNAPSIWHTMQYVPPRGQCNYKQTIVSPKCPCLRFMLHPLKSSSSYECDGCAHHASFHSMENKEEDEIRRRWEQEARDKQEREEGLTARPKKKLKEIGYQAGDAASPHLRALENGMLTPDGSASEVGSSRGKAVGRGQGRGRRQATGRQAKTRGRVETVNTEDEDEYIELD